MKLAFNLLIEYFTHDSFKKDNSLYEKSKFLIIVLLVVFIMLFFYTCYFLFNGFILNAKALENYIACIITLISLFVLKRNGNMLLPLYFLGTMGFVFVTASAYMSGGIYSNDISWYLALPVVTLMLIGIKEGIIAAIISLICTSVFYLLEIYNHKDFIADSIAYGLGYKFTNSFFILSLLILVMYTLVKSNKKLQNIIQFDREQKLREDISRDFHDQIGNKLASIQHLSNLSKMNKSPEEKEIILTKIGNHAKEVYDNFKDFIWTKDPESDQWNEIFMYLRDFAEDYLKHSNINLFVNARPESFPVINLPPNWSGQIVPIFKEVITNVNKHSKAKNVVVEFIYTPQLIEFKVKDDGIGIENFNRHKGKGLKNLYNRADRIGGFLKISSKINKGTEVHFSILLPEQGR